MRRAARLVVLYILEAVAALLALAIFASAAVLWRLAEGPVNAEFLRDSATQALLEAVDADIGSIGSIELSFDPALAAMVFTARDVRAVRTGGEMVVAADQVETALALDLLLIGRAAPVRIRAEGGTFSLVRDRDGQVFAGLGSPRAVRGGRRAAAVGEDASPSDPASSPEAPGRLGALASELSRQGSGPLSRLSEIDLRSVDLTVIDEATELTLLFQDARASLNLDEGALALDFSGGLISSSGLVPVALNLETGRDMQTVFVDLRVRDLVPATTAPLRGPLSALGQIDAPLAIDVVLDASAEDGLRAVNLAVSAGAGSVRTVEQSFAIDGADIRLALDAGAGELRVDAFDVQSDVLQLQAAGRISDLSVFIGALPTQAEYELVFSEGSFDWPGVFEEPLAWTGIEAVGRLDTAVPMIGFDQLDITLPQGATANFTGALSGAQTEIGWRPSVRLQGPISGQIAKRDVLLHWPVDFALGARDWVRDSILDGRLSSAQLDLNIPAQALAERALRDEHLSLRFAFDDADVRYVSTMTPLIGLSGEAELRGNSLSLSGRGAQIGGLDISSIFVEIPRLNPKGAPARFGGQGVGQVRDVLTLLGEPPLNLVENYGLSPDVFEGQGTMSFEIRRPMLREVPVEDVGFAVAGEFENVSAPSGFSDLRLEDARVVISADETGLRATGEASLAGASTQISWTETFGLGEDGDSTRIELATRMTARGLDRLGLPLRRFLDGPVGVGGVITGRGFGFSLISVDLDLTEAAVELPSDLWSKPPGEAATAQMTAVFGDAGALSLEGVSIQSESLRLQGRAELAADGRLLGAEIPQFVLPGRFDLAFTAERPEGPDGVLSLNLTGDYLDAGELVRLDAPGGGMAIGAPVSLDASLARLIVRDVAFTDIDLFARLGPDGLERASLSGQTSASQTPLSLSFEPDETGGRQLRAEAQDAGAVLAALTGFSNTAGGRISITAQSPALGQEGAMMGRINADAFTLERLPLLARILAAGSLEGLGGLLSGQGIEFERLEADFVWQDGSFEMRDARVAGPSLGVTWSGLVNFADPRMDIDGTILPSYGINSVLSSVPVFGELLTSREGEGVIGVTFSVAGPFDETRVTTNPLSALAPGVFRRMFEGTSAERELRALEERRRQDALDREAADTGSSEEPNPEDAEDGP